jgi:hypothetical protein
MPIEELDWEDQERPGPQTESTRERGFASDVDESALGRSEELDGEAGDIADEGPGHRG